MLKKTITFETVDGDKVTEDFYFNLSLPELTEMEVGMEGGMGEKLQKIIDSNDGAEIMKTFKLILEKSVGKRSEDGRRFLKTQEVIDDFMMSDAYSVLFTELCTNAKVASDFMSGLMPSQEKLNDFLKKTSSAVEDVELPGNTPEVPAYIREDREPTQTELMAMTKEQMLEAMKRRTEKISKSTDES